jgi:radical SAM superfamily enzyme YgiQ (UPF0313 family)
MKALLIYPEFPDTYWSFRHALSFEGKRSAFPPLGLLTISSMMPKSWERRLVDTNVCELKQSDIDWADIVFTSAMIVQKESLEEIVNLCKAAGKRVVVGGPYVSTSAEHLPEADHIFIGEAETTFPEFLRDLEMGVPLPIYKAEERPALTLTPVPDFQIADIGQYSAMSVQYSRGCPFQCEFCDIIEIYGRVPRTKTNEQVIAELDVLNELGWRGLVFIVDDNFIGNKKNVRLLLPALIEWSDSHGKPFSFITEASVNLAEDDALLEMMRLANFRRVFLGIETPVEESLKEAQKGQNTKRNLLESVRKIQSYGMEVMAGFIVGFDSDPDDIFDLQINFIRESGIPLAMVGLLTALPDTQLWRRLKSEGRLLKESSGDNTEGSMNFIPHMDEGVLLAGYKKVLNTIYSPAEYYKRALDCLSYLTEKPEPRRGSVFDDFRAFVRIVLTLGVRDPDRREFWRYIRQAITAHRRNFAHAVTLAAMGYHFRKLTLIYVE